MTNSGNCPRICIVVSDFMTVQAFLQDQIRTLSEMYEVTVVANTSDGDSLRLLDLNAELVPAPIRRNIDLWQDVRALLSLYSLFRKRKFTLVHSITPKAGLLSMLAGKFARIPTRVHTFTGQVWATASGWTRYLLKSADKLTAFCATQVLADSKSQLNFLVDEGVVGAASAVYWSMDQLVGSTCHDFVPMRQHGGGFGTRSSFRMMPSVFLFVGRLNKDKGVLDLARAFEHVAARTGNAY